ncbi:peptidase S8/S53 domain-containing protein [Daedaleopsis nitida]|nr:peptidase S8/S53 domain-containing protein [Daedaleopsis nitida]
MKHIPQNLDVDHTISLATNVPLTVFSVGNSGPDGQIYAQAFLDVANFLLAQDTVPHVLSISAGFDESTLCTVFMQLGARRTTVLSGSGDNGVSGAQETSQCLGSYLMSTFPNLTACTTPSITSVGSTQDISETATPFSSGGFSNLFLRPAYQDAAVQSYLTKLGNTNAGLFNLTGRHDFRIQQNGNDVPDIFGTNASSPTFASVVALLNDQLLHVGKSPLGFLNPMMYVAAADAFNDITTRINPGVSPGPCAGDGFPAMAGWDPVTGLGTPNFDLLSALVSKLGTSQDCAQLTMYIFAEPGPDPDPD